MQSSSNQQKNKRRKLSLLRAVRAVRRALHFQIKHNTHFPRCRSNRLVRITYFTFLRIFFFVVGSSAGFLSHISLLVPVQLNLARSLSSRRHMPLTVNSLHAPHTPLSASAPYVSSLLPFSLSSLCCWCLLRAPTVRQTPNTRAPRTSRSRSARGMPRKESSAREHAPRSLHVEINDMHASIRRIYQTDGKEKSFEIARKHKLSMLCLAGRYGPLAADESRTIPPNAEVSEAQK